LRIDLISIISLSPRTMRIFLLFLGFSLISLHFTDAQNSAKSFDWLRINPNENFENFDWSVLPEGVTKEMVTSTVSSPVISGKDHITLFPLGGKIYALFPCRFEVLVWMGNNWENLYKGYSAGNNCQAFFFVRNNVLYSYGKYGFWRAHSDLAYFDFQTGYWENVPAKNTPNNYAGVIPFLIGDKLITLMGQFINQSSGIDRIEKNGFYFDFNKGEWFPLKVEIPNQPDDSLWMYPSFDLKDFGIHPYKYLAEIGLLVLDKRDLKLHFRKMDHTPIGNQSLSYSKAKDNEIWFYSKDSKLMHFNFEKDLKTSFSKIGSIDLMTEWPIEESHLESNWKNWAIGILAIAFLGVLLSKIRKRKNPIDVEEKELEVKESANDQIDEEVSLVIRNLLEHPIKSFEVDAFDRLLGIDTIENLDYRRVKRNRLIKSMNDHYLETYGKPLLERTRLEQDKRIVIYHVIE